MTEFKVEITRIHGFFPYKYSWRVKHDFLYYHGISITRNGAEKAARKRAAKWNQDMKSRDNADTFTVGFPS